jgi:alpha-tubulin suppressor-like RCC1 family protein
MGYNGKGQLGIDSTENKLLPTQVKEAIGENKLLIKNRPFFTKVGEEKELELEVEVGFRNFNVYRNEDIASDLIFTSTDENIFTVSDTGVITGVSVGSAKVKVEDRATGLKTMAEIAIGENVDGAIAKPMIESGDGFSVALKQDGTVWATGKNNYGQLGNGTTENKDKFAQVKVSEDEYLTDVVQIASGGYHTLALKSDGTVWAWGYNDGVQLGDGTNTNRVYAIQVTGIEDIAQISTGGNSSYAIKNDGTAWAWGYNGYGQLGNGTTENKNIPQLVQGDTKGAIEIHGMGNSAVILKGDGTVYAWGLGDNGRLGQNDTASSSYPLQVKGVGGNGYLTDIEQVTGGHHHVVTLNSEKEMYGWGLGHTGQLGNNTTANNLTPIRINEELGDIKYIQAGAYSTYVITEDEKVYSKGYNDWGQLGDGTTTGRTTAVQMKNPENTGEISDVQYIGRAYVNYNDYATHTFVIKTDGSVYSMGYNGRGQLGIGSTDNKLLPTRVGENELLIKNRPFFAKVGERKSLEIEPGLLFNVYSGPNNSDLIYESTDEEIFTVSETGVITGRKAGSAKVKVEDRTTGLKTMTEIAIGENVEGAMAKPMIESGDGFSVALKQDGTVWTTGKNNVGQLGNGTIVDAYEFAQVKINENEYLRDVVQIASGVNYAIALKRNGTVWAWGHNGNGQLGNGTTEQKTYAVQIIEIEDIVHISAGTNTSYALKNDETVYAWGRNIYGEVGDGTTTDRHTPIIMQGNIN